MSLPSPTNGSGIGNMEDTSNETEEKLSDGAIVAGGLAKPYIYLSLYFIEIPLHITNAFLLYFT